MVLEHRSGIQFPLHPTPSLISNSNFAPPSFGPPQTYIPSILIPNQINHWEKKRVPDQQSFRPNKQVHTQPIELSTEKGNEERKKENYHYLQS